MHQFPHPPSGRSRRARSARIGLLLGDPVSDPVVAAGITAFRAGLRDAGYADGEGVALEPWSAEGRTDRFADLALGLVAARPDLIVASHPRAAAALAAATSTIPLVLVRVDPSAVGIGDVAHPGGNVTGIADGALVDGCAPAAMRLRLLKQTAPRVSRVAVLCDPDGDAAELREMRATAADLHVWLQPSEVRREDDFDSALAAAGRADALIVLARALALPRAAQIAQFALRQRLPSMHSGREFVVAGGLMSYHGDDRMSWRRAAAYASRILDGEAPGKLAMDRHAAACDLTLNECTAAELGTGFPASILSQATEVITCDGSW